jgi:NAD(P)-dependent dehydrogenase (short-subunit alcohol dehydrogenase family)
MKKAIVPIVGGGTRMDPANQVGNQHKHRSRLRRGLYPVQVDLQLTGRRALVIGGTKGIGRAIARTLSGEGAELVIASRSDGSAVAAEIAARTGGNVRWLHVDNRDDATVQHLVAEVVAVLGGIDILVNTAAEPWSADKNSLPSQTGDDVMREQLEGKVLGYLRAARAVAPHMVAAGWGRIINVSGLAARTTGQVAQTFRNVSVAAVTKNLADELGPHGINVTVVHPGMTRTATFQKRMTERAQVEDTTVEALEEQFASNSIHRLVDADDVAAVVAFLASPLSVAITGDPIAVAGGAVGAIYY